MLQQIGQTVKDLIYERRCGVCKSPILTEEIICISCNPIKTLLSHSNLLTPPYCQKCGEGGEGIEEGISDFCQSCFLYPLPIQYVRSIWSYTDTAESLICAYKYANSRSLAAYISEISSDAIRSGIYPPKARYNWDLILPLPSTNESLRQRGFSPVAEIVKLLSVKLKLPVSLLALGTTGIHPAQASLSPADRLKHIKRKYWASPKQIAGKRILLIDDVITSGASIVGSTIALLNAGALTVDALSICRSELFGQLRGQIYSKL